MGNKTTTPTIERVSFLKNEANRSLLGVVMILFVMTFISIVGVIANNMITDYALSPKRLAALERLKKISNPTPPVVTSNNLASPASTPIANVNNSTLPVKQTCYTYPQDGWKEFISRNRSFAFDNRVLPGGCFDMVLPDEIKEVAITFYEIPKIVRGKFVLRTEKEMCVSNDEAGDNCLDFVKNHLQQNIVIAGKQFYIEKT